MIPDNGLPFSVVNDLLESCGCPLLRIAGTHRVFRRNAQRDLIVVPVVNGRVPRPFVSRILIAISQSQDESDSTSSQ